MPWESRWIPLLSTFQKRGRVEELLVLCRKSSAKFARMGSWSSQRQGMLDKPQSQRRSSTEKRVHPGFRNRGLNDLSRFTPEKLTKYEVFKRVCRVLDDVEKLPLIPTSVINAKNPPEKAWVSTWFLHSSSFLVVSSCCNRLNYFADWCKGISVSASTSSYWELEPSEWWIIWRWPHLWWGSEQETEEWKSKIRSLEGEDIRIWWYWVSILHLKLLHSFPLVYWLQFFPRNPKADEAKGWKNTSPGHPFLARCKSWVLFSDFSWFSNIRIS